jgi:hypothetical protein
VLFRSGTLRWPPLRGPDCPRCERAESVRCLYFADINIGEDEMLKLDDYEPRNEEVEK